jgi:hypothetical protein
MPMAHHPTCEVGREVEDREQSFSGGSGHFPAEAHRGRFGRILQGCGSGSSLGRRGSSLQGRNDGSLQGRRYGSSPGRAAGSMQGRDTARWGSRGAAAHVGEGVRLPAGAQGVACSGVIREIERRGIDR